MRYKEIFRVLGSFLFYFSILLVFPLCVAIYYEIIAAVETHPQPHSSLAFFLTFICCILTGFFFRFHGKKASGKLFRQDSIFLVVCIWLVSCTIAALPFYFSKTLPNFLDAYFESMSGLTTTGATLLVAKSFTEDGQEQKITIPAANNSRKSYSYYGTIEPVFDPYNQVLLEGFSAVSKAILLWRCFLQWLGGMGIVVLFLTVLPALGVGGKTLYQTEMTGFVEDNISPRLKETAWLLWKLYICLSLLEVASLLITNSSMPFFDAICITFSNLSTGGFAIHETSIGYYDNIYTEWVVILFMILGSINFNIYFHIIRGKFYKIYRSDFFVFLTFLLIGSALVSAFIIHTPNEEIVLTKQQYSLAEAIRSGVFHWVSAQSSTGYFTANYDLWPINAKVFLLLAMFLGGMTGSTSGGIKTTRYYLLAKIARNRLERLFHADTLRIIRFGKIEIDSTIAIMILLFFCLGFACFITGAILFILTGIDLETSVGLISCFINNVGVAFRAAGPINHINFLSPLAKILSMFWMLVGRLEYFAIIVLFFPSFWKNK